MWSKAEYMNTQWDSNSLLQVVLVKIANHYTTWGTLEGGDYWVFFVFFVSLSRALAYVYIYKVLGMTLNCIWWWGLSSVDLGSLKYSFFASIPRSTLTQIGSSC